MGRMNSFIGIAQTQTTNLAVVALVLEALLATAIGLVAAIPAVVIYNIFASDRQLQSDAGRRGGAGIAAASRDLDHECERQCAAGTRRAEITGRVMRHGNAS